MSQIAGRGGGASPGTRDPLQQMCSAIVNRHVRHGPSYYRRRMINRLIRRKHQCKATEQ